MQHGTGFERSPDDDFHAYCLCFAHSCACIAGSAHGTALWKEVHSSSLLMGLYPDNLYMVGFYHNRHRLYLGYYFKRRACSGRTSGKSLAAAFSVGRPVYLLDKHSDVHTFGFPSAIYMGKLQKSGQGGSKRLLSLSIEFAQLATNRVSDIDDLLTNTLGAVSGYGLWMLLGRHFFGCREERRTVALGNWEAVLYLLSAYMCSFLLNNKAWFI